MNIDESQNTSLFMSKTKKQYLPSDFKRNEYGLLTNQDHKFNEDGSVNWRAMIKPEYLYPNRERLEKRGKEEPEDVSDLQDDELLIMLGGIKELAKLRGFTDVHYEIKNVESEYVTAKCRIKWLPNYETSDKEVVFEDCASAHNGNTDSFGLNYLETMACNRAFVRCVRNFLNIHIVGADEISKQKGNYQNRSSTEQSVAGPISPVGLLEKISREKYASPNFDDFKEVLRDLWIDKKYTNEEVKTWKSFNDIPSREARKLLIILAK